MSLAKFPAPQAGDPTFNRASTAAAGDDSGSNGVSQCLGRMAAAIESIASAMTRLADHFDADDDKLDDSSDPTSFLTITQVAKLIGCCYSEARERMLDGRIRAIKDGRWIRSRKDWVDEYLAGINIAQQQTNEMKSCEILPKTKVTAVKPNGVGLKFLRARKS